MQWSHAIDSWIVVVGVLCALSCALLGNFLVLRRMSMMGDAISHAVLPGLAVAFLISESRTSAVMFLGAAVVGVLTAVFTQWVHSFGRVDRGAAMGVVFTTLFAIGLILIVRAADHVDLDPGCVLYGSIELAPLDRLPLAGLSVPRSAIVLGGVLLLNLLFVVIFYKELKISSFDPALATSLGINARVMHYALMTMVAITTVACFESIGSILVIAMLIVPAATAHLLTDRMRPMILVSLVIAAACAALGHVSAVTVPSWVGVEGASTAGMMAVVAGLVFAVVVVLAPRHGVLVRLLQRARTRLRTTQEDALTLLLRLEELGPIDTGRVSPTALLQRIGSGRMLSRLALHRLRVSGQVRREGASYRLTDAGRSQATGLLRAHRLWESFLVQHLPLAPDHVHASAERLEHVTSERMRRDLAAATRSPTHDPHGRRIPPGDEEDSPQRHRGH
ncbi:MAG: metal ABC transporter permease [Planctomycetota bacterium]|jgi:manganese/zinc/iron transport system permease protein